MMQRIHIVGRRNHGKTTLVVELVAEFCRRGLRVGTVKHSRHAHDLDTPGKDSHRHRLAGGRPAAIVTQDLVGVFLPRTDPCAYDRLAPLFADCQLVIVEGNIDTPGLKIEVWRAAVGGACLANERSDIAAIVSDDQPRVAVPVWPRRDIAHLADQVLACMALRYGPDHPEPHD
jgi:molybdopterin-guanine dinucleotide biosynthesis protein B